MQPAAACRPMPNAPGLSSASRCRAATMTDVTPAKLADTRIRVLNASGQGGQAAEVAGALRDLGFAQPTAANDPIYAAARLTCQGQIRFGATARPPRRRVWLVAPCTELFQDDRPDDSVDLALGTEFTELTHSDDIDAVLAGLRPDATEPADPALLSKIHSGDLLSAHAGSGRQSRRARQCVVAERRPMPGAAATTRPGAVSPGGGSRTRAPASAAISAPAAQSHTCSPCS